MPGGRGVRQVARSTAIQATADLVGKVASLFFYVAIARNLGQAGFGAFTFAAAIAIVFVAFAAFGTDYVITRETARGGSASTTQQLLWQAMAIKLVFGSIGIALALLFALVAGSGGEALLAVAIMSLASLVEILTKTLHAVLRGTHDTGPVGAGLVVQRVGTALVAVPLLKLGATLTEVCAIYLAGALAGAIWVLAVMLRRRQISRPAIDARAAWMLLILSIPIGLNEIFGVVMSRVDVGILALLKDDRAVGLYGAAYRLFESTLFLSWGFGAAALPAFTVLTPVSNPTIGRALELGLKASAAMLFPVGAMLAAFAPLVTDLVYGDAYAGSVAALRWLGVAAATYGLFMLPSFLLIATGRVRALAWITGAAIGVNVLANLALIPRFSIAGSAAAMAVTQLGLSGAMVYVASRQTEAPSLSRVFGGPVAGSAVIVILALTLGQNLGTLTAAAVAYGLVLVAIEHRLHPGDIGLVRTVIRRRIGR